MNKRQITADLGVTTYAPLVATLAEFKADLDALAESIGADAETANVVIEYEHDYHDGGGSVNAYIWRWETDEEAAAREAHAATERLAAAERQAAEDEAQERHMLEALKAKYETPRGAAG